MSRSRRKPKIGWCTGSNTEYYRDRNRSTRIKNKRKLRKALMEGEEDMIDFIVNNKNSSFDSWCEPTDGSYLLTKSSPHYEKYCRK